MVKKYLVWVSGLLLVVGCQAGQTADAESPATAEEDWLLVEDCVDARPYPGGFHEVYTDPTPESPLDAARGVAWNTPGVTDPEVSVEMHPTDPHIATALISGRKGAILAVKLIEAGDEGRSYWAPAHSCSADDGSPTRSAHREEWNVRICRDSDA